MRLRLRGWIGDDDGISFPKACILTPMGFKEDFPDLEQQNYPSLLPGTYTLTSDCTDDYNCVAWAADDDSTCWWPWEGYFWPPGVTFEESLAAFTEAFATLGYEQCPDGDLEPGWEKVVIFAKGSEPKHVARQIESGAWTSKLGGSRDIEHELEAVSGPYYGKPALFLKRLRRL